MLFLNRALPPALVLIVTLLVLAVTLHLNNGVFVYALDDPYIHLDLADTLWRTGIYGVNDGQYSAPSSSILWPELLFIGVGQPWHVYMPLILALAFSMVTASLILPLMQGIFGAGRHKQALLFTCLACFTFNLPALAMSGMEHSLQLLLTALAVLGLIRFHDTGKVPGWLWLALILGPLVRYENILVTAATLAILTHQGQWKKAIPVGFITLGLLGAFSAFLLHLGLDALPSSTIVKRLRWGADYWEFWGRALAIILRTPMAWVTLGFGATGGIWALRHWNWRDHRWFATAILSGTVLMHLFIGRFGGADFTRYELYVVLFSGFYGAWLWRERMWAALQKPKMVGLVTFCLFMLVLPGIRAHVMALPLASQAIYLQQEQMGRLARDFWQKPIAVNDIGIVGYRNPHNVLDLIGLADRNARIASWSHDPGALDRYVRSQDIDLLIIYRNWFGEEKRGKWVALGELFRPAGMTGFGAPSVLLMTPYPEKAESIRAVLREWAKTLPPHTAYVEYDEAHPAPPGKDSPLPPQPLD